MKNRKMVVELRDKITNEFVKNVEFDLTKSYVNIANMQWLQTKFNVNVVEYRGVRKNEK